MYVTLFVEEWSSPQTKNWVPRNFLVIRNVHYRMASLTSEQSSKLKYAKLNRIFVRTGATQPLGLRLFGVIPRSCQRHSKVLWFWHVCLVHAASFVWHDTNSGLGRTGQNRFRLFQRKIGMSTHSARNEYSFCTE